MNPAYDDEYRPDLVGQIPTAGSQQVYNQVGPQRDDILPNITSQSNPDMAPQINIESEKDKKRVRIKSKSEADSSSESDEDSLDGELPSYSDYLRKFNLS